MKGKILIIDDDQFLTKSLARLMEGQGHEVGSANTIEDGWRSLSQSPPDLLILDLSLPDGDGITLCRRIRTQFKFPILMLTSRGDSIDKVMGLEVGADDYLTKPFDAHELAARVKALLRRQTEYGSAATPGAPLELGAIQIDPSARVLRVNGAEVTLTQTEFDLLFHLASRPGIAQDRNEVFRAVWGYDSEFSSNSLDVLVYRLRTKLKEAGAPDVILTVRGFGFKFQP